MAGWQWGAYSKKLYLYTQTRDALLCSLRHSHAFTYPTFNIWAESPEDNMFFFSLSASMCLGASLGLRCQLLHCENGATDTR